MPHNARHEQQYGTASASIPIRFGRLTLTPCLAGSFVGFLGQRLFAVHPALFFATPLGSLQLAYWRRWVGPRLGGSGQTLEGSLSLHRTVAGGPMYLSAHVQYAPASWTLALAGFQLNLPFGTSGGVRLSGSRFSDGSRQMGLSLALSLGSWARLWGQRHRLWSPARGASEREHIALSGVLLWLPGGGYGLETVRREGGSGSRAFQIKTATAAGTPAKVSSPE
ncbi:MAG: hypothetical protein RMK61_04840 [Bacteroidota bacterium]|nr:hypothetical protein [Bacteroidota bacterium]